MDRVTQKRRLIALLMEAKSNSIYLFYDIVDAVADTTENPADVMSRAHLPSWETEKDPAFVEFCCRKLVELCFSWGIADALAAEIEKREREAREAAKGA